jgi:signal transduction histidine kinase
MDDLAQFIRDNLEAILKDWEAFARGTGPASLSVPELRNDAERMLRFIAHDMETPQTAGEQRLKSEGRASPLPSDSAAHDHGAQRFSHGFDMNQMVSEYRALRATVIRLWASQNATPMEDAVQQLVRFNEGLDQAITESIARFTGEVDKSRDLFLAALGHDVRTPLSAIAITAEAMIKEASPVSRERGARILRSSHLLASIANDLLDFTRTRMGGPLPIQKTAVEIEDVVDGVVQELRAGHPERTITVKTSGDTKLHADPTRVAQALSNLILNALQHGGERQPVDVYVEGRPEHLQVAVHNAGAPISADRVPELFRPWMSHSDARTTSNSGLGLYIVRQIALAHDGQVTVESSREHGTTFTLTLPRRTAGVDA